MGLWRFQLQETSRNNNKPSNFTYLLKYKNLGSNKRFAKCKRIVLLIIIYYLEARIIRKYGHTNWMIFIYSIIKMQLFSLYKMIVVSLLVLQHLENIFGRDMEPKENTCIFATSTKPHCSRYASSRQAIE
jgi:hypothetical protein